MHYVLHEGVILPQFRAFSVAFTVQCSKQCSSDAVRLVKARLTRILLRRAPAPSVKKIVGRAGGCSVLGSGAIRMNWHARSCLHSKANYCRVDASTL